MEPGTSVDQEQSHGLLKLIARCAIALMAAISFVSFGGIDWVQAVLTPGNPAPVAELPAGIFALSFDAVSADPNGMLLAAGKGPADAKVMLFNGAEKLGEVKSDENGEWILTLGAPLSPGQYVLSLKAIDPRSNREISGRRTFSLTIAPRKSRL